MCVTAQATLQKQVRDEIKWNLWKDIPKFMDNSFIRGRLLFDLGRSNGENMNNI